MHFYFPRWPNRRPRFSIDKGDHYFIL
jgi:hypothetical protein